MIRRFTWVAVAGIAVVLTLASWLPGAYLVRTGVLSQHQEHFIAYLGAGLLLGGLVSRGFTYFRAAFLLIALAGFLELGQLFIPRRAAGHSFRSHFRSCPELPTKLCATCARST